MNMRAIVLVDYKYNPVEEDEIRTAIHFSKFKGHEKKFLFNCSDIPVEITWRKGHYETFAKLNDEETALESIDPLDHLRITIDGETYDSVLPDYPLAEFLKQVSSQKMNETNWLIVPRSIDRLLPTYSMIA